MRCLRTTLPPHADSPHRQSYGYLGAGLRHTQGMDPSHPPLDLPFYGVAADWGGPRWLAHVDGPLGHPADGIWLRHGSPIVHDARSPWLQIGTLREDRFPGREVAHAERAASTATFALVDATMPREADRPPGYKDRVMSVANARAEQHEAWPDVTWSVDGEPVRASVTRWAGAWAAFTTLLPRVDVVVVGSGFDPDGLALAEVVDSSAYHFDRHARLVFPDTVEQSRAAAGVDPAAGDDVWWPAHPDHATV